MSCICCISHLVQFHTSFIALAICMWITWKLWRELFLEYSSVSFSCKFLVCFYCDQRTHCIAFQLPYMCWILIYDLVCGLLRYSVATLPIMCPLPWFKGWFLEFSFLANFLSSFSINYYVRGFEFSTSNYGFVLVACYIHQFSSYISQLSCMGNTHITHLYLLIWLLGHLSLYNICLFLSLIKKLLWN